MKLDDLTSEEIDALTDAELHALTAAEFDAIDRANGLMWTGQRHYVLRDRHGYALCRSSTTHGEIVGRYGQGYLERAIADGKRRDANE